MLIAEVTAEPLQIGSILMGLIGGLALFLFGLDQMSDALKLIAGDGHEKGACQADDEPVHRGGRRGHS